MARRLRVRDRVVPSKATFIQTASRQHAQMMELAQDVEKLQAVIRILQQELRNERARTIRSRVWEKVELWVRHAISETAKLGSWQ